MKNHAQKYRGMECFFENERGTAFVFFSQYSLGGQAVTVKGPRATLTEHPGTIAGSATCLYDCMKRVVLEMGVPLESAVRAASENPARSIGIDNDYGSLSAGRYGNVILADEALNIQAVVQKGTRIV